MYFKLRMRRRIHQFLFLLLMMLAPTLFATTCPDIAEIKQQKLRGFKLYSRDKTKLTEIHLQQFKKQIEAFALAEWIDDQPQHGTIKCYYRDKAGATLRIYLSQNNIAPDNAKNYWYSVTGSTQCAAGQQKCQFTSYSSLTTLAHKK